MHHLRFTRWYWASLSDELKTMNHFLKGENRNSGTNRTRPYMKQMLSSHLTQVWCAKGYMINAICIANHTVTSFTLDMFVYKLNGKETTQFPVKSIQHL